MCRSTPPVDIGLYVYVEGNQDSVQNKSGIGYG